MAAETLKAKTTAFIMGLEVSPVQLSTGTAIVHTLEAKTTAFLVDFETSQVELVTGTVTAHILKAKTTSFVTNFDAGEVELAAAKGPPASFTNIRVLAVEPAIQIDVLDVWEIP